MPESNDIYRVEIDAVDEDKWNESLRLFEDGSLYQTWAYGRMKVGDLRLRHVMVWHQDKLAAMCQVRIMKIRPFPWALAYVHWGPLWKRNDMAASLDHLKHILMALQEEYVHRQRMMLRIVPQVVESGLEGATRAVFEELGFTWSPDPGQTFFIDLSVPLETIKSNLQRDWRRDLRNAEKQGLLLSQGTGTDLLAIALGLGKEMKERKRFYGTGGGDFLEVQRDLPEEQRITVLIASNHTEPVAALGWQTIGKIGFPVIAATGNHGLKLKASFLLWWKMIEYYHELGFKFLDVGGVNAKRNPGGFLFKSRLTGKKDPQPDHYIGQFTAYHGKGLPFLFTIAYTCKLKYKHIRAKAAKFFHSRSKRIRSLQ